MSEKRYDQPFCIIGSVGHFAECYRERGYLPALNTNLIYELIDADRAETERLNRRCKLGESEGETEKPHTEPPWNNRQWDYVQQLKAQILFLENKINEHIDKPKTAQRQLKAIDV